VEVVTNTSSLTLTGEDWSASDYQALNVEPHNGKEFVLFASFEWHLMSRLTGT
jgi:hypothetical protein